MAAVDDYLWHFFGGLDLAALADGSIVPQLKPGIVARIGIGLPPSDELAEVIARLQAFEQEAEATRNGIKAATATAADLRQCIFAAAFRGELVQ